MTADPLVGSVVAGRYRVIAPLGRGGMGAVYRVEHTEMKKELALKLLHPELSRFDDVAQRFRREAEAAARLDHPNIVTVTDFGSAEGVLFLVMELCQGPSLTSVIRPDLEHGRPLPAARALHILAQILRALERAHASGIVHRDLKPDNIVLIEREGDPDFVKLLDFGIARMLDPEPLSEGAGRAQTLTQAGLVFGTPEYLSPEQAMGQPADGRADLYAAGVILYEMLTGQRPFEASSRVALVSMHLTQRAKPMRKVAPQAHIPPALEGVVARAMAKKRDERFATAGAFLANLDGVGAQGQNGGARQRLTDGARRLTDGARRLTDGARWLTDGARWLTDGTRRLTDGAHRLADGAGRLAERAGVPRRRALWLVAACAALMLLALLVVARRPPLPAPAPALAVDEALDRLRSAHGCKERKAAALQIIATGDRRYLDSLRAARDRRGGFLGLEAANECMMKDLNAAIRKLEAK